MQQLERSVKSGGRALRSSSAGLQPTATIEFAGRDLRCECGQLRCQATLPSSAEHHRGLGSVLVFPGHQGENHVLAAADRFFVVEHTRSGRAA